MTSPGENLSLFNLSDHFKFPARMLIENFESSLACAAFLDTGQTRSRMARTTLNDAIGMEPYCVRNVL